MEKNAQLQNSYFFLWSKTHHGLEFTYKGLVQFNSCNPTVLC